VTDADLVRLIDQLEDAASSGYLTLEQLEAAAGEPLAPQVAAGLLLVDYRTRVDGSEVTVCRLNRHHPLVAQLTTW
jgi:hypothetical protein